MPSIEEQLSKFKMKVAIDANTDHWWLTSDSNLEHSKQPPVKKEAQKGSNADIISDKLFVMQLYYHSIPPSKMSHIMTNLVGKEYSGDTISNLTKKGKEEMDLANIISLDLSSEQKT